MAIDPFFFQSDVRNRICLADFRYRRSNARISVQSPLLMAKTRRLAFKSPFVCVKRELFPLICELAAQIRKWTQKYGNGWNKQEIGRKNLKLPRRTGSWLQKNADWPQKQKILPTKCDGYQNRSAENYSIPAIAEIYRHHVCIRPDLSKSTLREAT